MGDRTAKLLAFMSKFGELTIVNNFSEYELRINDVLGDIVAVSDGIEAAAETAFVELRKRLLERAAEATADVESLRALG